MNIRGILRERYWEAIHHLIDVTSSTRSWLPRLQSHLVTYGVVGEVVNFALTTVSSLCSILVYINLLCAVKIAEIVIGPEDESLKSEANGTSQRLNQEELDGEREEGQAEESEEDGHAEADWEAEWENDDFEPQPPPILNPWVRERLLALLNNPRQPQPQPPPRAVDPFLFDLDIFNQDELTSSGSVDSLSEFDGLELEEIDHYYATFVNVAFEE